MSTEIEQQLLQHEAVAALYRYVGGSGFRFYYNMGGAPNESHLARFTINTRSEADNLELVNWVRRELTPSGGVSTDFLEYDLFAHEIRVQVRVEVFEFLSPW